MTQVSLAPILFWVSALAATGIAVWRGPCPMRDFVTDRLLRYPLIFPLGLPGAIGRGDRLARQPVPVRGGLGQSRIGLASLYAAFRAFEARLAASLAAAAFLMGAGVIHITDIVATGNLAPGNAGSILVTDFLTPIVVLVLLYLSNDVATTKSATMP